MNSNVKSRLIAFITLPIVLGASLSLTACNQSNTKTEQKASASQTSSTASATPTTLALTVDKDGNAHLQPASTVTAPKTPISDVKLTDPLTQLVATTMNNGFLLAVNQHAKLSATQKQCLMDFDNQQAVTLAQKMLSFNLTQTEVSEANTFYALPVGQKIIKFNQKYLDDLKHSHSKAGNLDVTDDEKLQISAFIDTATGRKIQQLASGQLQSAFAPVEQQQLQKCQVSVEQFNAPINPPANDPKSASAPTPSATVKTEAKAVLPNASQPKP
ncbi:MULTISPECIES: hypothetical protein [unclassified Moraxella]|uniref:hypothetical protein n=1 Tax=unclassified Moraxella TaxID=2685852 RepID=UPI003AF922D9